MYCDFRLRLNQLFPISLYTKKRTFDRGTREEVGVPESVRVDAYYLSAADGGNTKVRRSNCAFTQSANAFYTPHNSYSSIELVSQKRCNLMAFHASFRSPRSFQASRFWNTSPLMKNSPVIRAQPLRACQEQSAHSPNSPYHHDTSRFLYGSDNDDDRLTRRKPGNRQPMLLGLGLVFPASVSHPAMSHDDALFVDDSNIVATCVQAMGPLERSDTVNELPQKPVLHPVDIQDEISPILPLPPIDPTHCSSVTASTSTKHADLIYEILPTDTVTRPTNKRLSTVDYIRAKIGTSDPMITEDITSNVLRNESSDRGHGNVKLSFIDEIPTVDIADQGLSLDNGTFGISGFFDPECKCGCALSHDDDIVEKRTTNVTQSSASPHTSPSAWQLCSIPIYHTEPRGCDWTNRRVNPRTSARYAIFRSSNIIRDPAIRTQKRSRQPIEASSPSMTPSPTNSPKFCIVPVAEHRTESPDTPSSKAGRNRSSTACKQLVQGRSSKPEAAWNGSRRGALHSPNTRWASEPSVPSLYNCVTLGAGIAGPTQADQYNTQQNP
ncbi:hypothetical protein F5887DRAFT_917948 [Amanita rubescens]|nr:hypothetical protein F5887DRAFT_917948 [Amanita rubescens]